MWWQIPYNSSYCQRHRLEDHSPGQLRQKSMRAEAKRAKGMTQLLVCTHQMQGPEFEPCPCPPNATPLLYYKYKILIFIQIYLMYLIIYYLLYL
jgi:hypothetical protein